LEDEAAINQEKSELERIVTWEFRTFKNIFLKMIYLKSQ
jgi:hypothetical protein